MLMLLRLASIQLNSPVVGSIEILSYLLSKNMTRESSKDVLYDHLSDFSVEILPASF